MREPRARHTCGIQRCDEIERLGSVAGLAIQIQKDGERRSVRLDDCRELLAITQPNGVTNGACFGGREVADFAKRNRYGERLADGARRR
jgi:hypothetical protein